MSITLLYSHHSEFPGNWTWVSKFPSVVGFLWLFTVFWVLKPRHLITDGDGLNQIVSEIIDYEQSEKSDPLSDLSGYIREQFGFNPAGQVISSGGNTEIQIFNVDTGQLRSTTNFTIVPGSQTIGGLALINVDELVIINNPNPPASSEVSISWVCNNDAQLTLTL